GPCFLESSRRGSCIQSYLRKCKYKDQFLFPALPYTGSASTLTLPAFLFRAERDHTERTDDRFRLPTPLFPRYRAPLPVHPPEEIACDVLPNRKCSCSLAVCHPMYRSSFLPVFLMLSRPPFRSSPSPSGQHIEAGGASVASPRHPVSSDSI